jgi:hypothetical protein
MKHLFSGAAVLVLGQCFALAAQFQPRPSVPGKFAPPVVLLVAVDPYFSIWSQADWAPMPKPPTLVTVGSDLVTDRRVQPCALSGAHAKSGCAASLICPWAIGRTSNSSRIMTKT